MARHRDPGGCHPHLRGGWLFGPHVVGYTGVITDTQYQQAVEDGNTYDAEDNISGYKWSDTMGRSGLEAAFEEELRGKRGEETIYTDGTGTVTSTAVTTAPEEGHTIQTTLDSDLQRVANLSLEKNIQSNTDARDATSGAAVVLDVDTFGVLACSSYPTYDVNQLVESIAGDGEYYNNLLADEDQPMVNLALNGVFIPGSVFKPVVALAALQEGVISSGTTYTCTRVWNYFDLSQGCLCGGGTWNLYGALAHSCNTYFSNVGLNLGIARLAPYAEYFGLGTTTGVEIGESTGTMSNPQEYRENHGVNWTDGVSAQTAIGQADNMFTPIQLATMCATIANGGVRLQTHFLDKVLDYTGETVLEAYEPVELYDAGLSSAVLGVVQTGMQMVATEGNAGTVFANYPVSIACKTGTAETSTGKNGTEPNLSFICYAPADDPEIAIAVMMEYGNTATMPSMWPRTFWTSTLASTPGMKRATSSTRTATRWTTAALSLRQPRKSPRSRPSRKAPPRPSRGTAMPPLGQSPPPPPRPPRTGAATSPTPPSPGRAPALPPALTAARKAAKAAAPATAAGTMGTGEAPPAPQTGPITPAAESLGYYREESSRILSQRKGLENVYSAQNSKLRAFVFDNLP